ncbi:IS3 family transposase [Kitasatospora sp. NPDC001159]
MIALLDEHPLGVEPVLRETGTAPSTYYRRRLRERQPTRREQEDAVLTEKIEAIHEQSHGIYGSPRVHARPAGVRVGRKRVERLMRQAGLDSPTRAADLDIPHR